MEGDREGREEEGRGREGEGLGWRMCPPLFETCIRLSFLARVDPRSVFWRVVKVTARVCDGT